MADTKISALTDVGTLASGDLFAIDDVSAAASKSATAAEINTFVRGVTPSIPTSSQTSGKVLQSDGTNFVAAVQTGVYLGRQIKISGTTYTPTTGTSTIVIKMVGGGGQGGGALGGSSSSSLGSGGGGGAYLEKRVTGVTGTYSYTIGAGGSTSTGQATGQAGGSTTFVNGGTTYTAPGGAGGLSIAAGTTVIGLRGGAAGAVATNGDLNSTGYPGMYGSRYSGVNVQGGSGGSSQFGGGGLGAGTTAADGGAAGGFGAGGGGATSVTAVAQNGGAGSGGCIIIEEFS